MSEHELVPVPPSWAVVRLGDMGCWYGGGTPSKGKSKYWNDGEVPWVSPKDMKSEYIEDSVDHITQVAVEESSTKMVPAGSILIVARSGILQRTLPVAMVVRDVTMNQDMKAIHPHDGFNSTFLMKFLVSSTSNILNDCCKSGTTVASLETSRLLDYPVAVAPLNEQRRIVAKIDALQARSRRAREALDAVPALLDRFRQSVLAAAFRGDLTADWRAKNPDVEPASVLLDRIRAERKVRWIAAEAEKARARAEARAVKAGKAWSDKDNTKALKAAEKKATAKYKEPEPVDAEAEGLPELPEGWCWASVDETMLVVVDCPHSTPKYGDGAHFALDTNAMSAAGIRLTKLRQLDKPAFDLRNKRLVPKPGDVVFAREGTVGNAVVLPNSPPLALGQRVMLMRPPRGLHSSIVAQAIMSPLVRNQYTDKLVGTTVAHVNMRDIKRFRLPIPPEAEQEHLHQAIAGALRHVKTQISRMRSMTGILDTLDQSILAKAFRGELVPQDPHDEPASVLLERIQAERAAAAAKAAAAKKKPARKTSTKKTKP